MNIIICRHGETDANSEQRLVGVTDIHLNSKGLEQADILGKYLSRFDFSAIYSASLLRAMETSKQIVKYQKNSNIISSPAFNERNFGDYEMKTWGEVFAEIPNLRKRWKTEKEEFRFPNGEILGDLITRVQNAFKTTIERHSTHESILYVAHGGSVKAMMGYMLGTKKEYIPSLCRQDYCCVNFFIFDGSKFKVDLIDYIEYRKDIDGI